MTKNLTLLLVFCVGWGLTAAGCGEEGTSPEAEAQRADMPIIGGKADIPSWLRHIPVEWGCDQSVVELFWGADSAHLYSFPGKVGYRYTFDFEASYDPDKGAVVAVYDAETGNRVAIERAWDNTVSLQYTAERNVKYLVAVYSIYVYATSWYTLTASCEVQSCKTSADCGDGEYCKKLMGCDTAAQGTCTERPEICYEIYAPVCGCDGKTYGNDCDAATAGQNIAHEGECAPQTSACEAAGGICAHWMDSCQAGYVGDAPMGCPMGKSAQCCLPMVKIGLSRPGFVNHEAIGATITNASSTLSAFLPGCSVVSWQQEVDGVWTDEGPEHMCVWEGNSQELAAGEAIEQTLGGRDPGTWRLVVEYGVDCAAGVPLSQGQCDTVVKATSEPFLVKDCPLLTMPNPDAFCPDGDIVPTYDVDGVCVHGYECLPKCRRTGCSGQLCADENLISTCEYLPWYTCFSYSQCGRFGPENTCAWEETDAYRECLALYGK